MMTEEQVEQLRKRVCARKKKLGAAAARRIVEESPRGTDTKLGAYRCPFCEPFEDSGAAVWHVGHGPKPEVLAAMAQYLRERSQGAHR